ncbi:MAG: hypothetical protein M1821_007931 [Bathelium mastoideum]|nr:MAG: hypothetical protein M1821_007931 [Bathelium mastoideum]
MINFYLKNIVFPEEAPGRHPTIGFSGTNEGQYVLPLIIKQEDLAFLDHINAADLSKLLLAENQSYTVNRRVDGCKLLSQEFLSLVASQGKSPSSSETQSPIKVLIDVGAQIIDLRNEDIVREWLGYAMEVEAVVFFGDDHEAMVLERGGCINTLHRSPYRDRLDCCLIYLDEAHTRGIDLPIPFNTRAAVTLGPNLVQDRLMLGDGHTISFFGPPEVHSHILSICQKDDAQKLTSSDVVHWSITNTIARIKDAQPLRIVQGFRHLQQRRLWEDYTADGHGVTTMLDSQRALKFWKNSEEIEDQSLVSLYADGWRHFDHLKDRIDCTSQDPLTKRLLQEHSELQDMNAEYLSINEVREMEREITHEIQQERKVQKPEGVNPRRHDISKGLKAFIKCGVIGPEASLLPAFDTFIPRKCAGLDPHLADAWTSAKCTRNLYVTSDFYRSVRIPKDAPIEDFHRKVRYIVTNVHAP